MTVADYLRATAGTVDRVVADALERTALEAKGAFIAAAPGGGHLSGAGRKGARLSARYDRQKGSRGLVIRVRAVGPWQWNEYGRRGGYPIPKRKGKGPNARRKVARLHGERWSSGRISGGAQGARPAFGPVAERVLEQFPRDLERAVVEVLARG